VLMPQHPDETGESCPEAGEIDEFLRFAMKH
jgi:hypothetical protein